MKSSQSHTRLLTILIFLTLSALCSAQTYDVPGLGTLTTGNDWVASSRDKFSFGKLWARLTRQSQLAWMERSIP
jgi:hypothetical protein